MSTLDAAQVNVTFSPGWDEIGRTPALVSLLQRARRARAFGDFWQHCLVAEGAVDVAVFDLRGRRVRTLPVGSGGAARRTLRWDGRDDAGVELPSGAYFVRAAFAGRQRSVKLVLAR